MNTWIGTQDVCVFGFSLILGQVGEDAFEESIEFMCIQKGAATVVVEIVRKVRVENKRKISKYKSYRQRSPENC